MAFFIKISTLVILFGLIVVLQGCASTSSSTDVPWNVPQPWEGVPGIPGSQ